MEISLMESSVPSRRGVQVAIKFVFNTIETLNDAVRC